MKQRLFIIVWSIAVILVTGLCIIGITSLIPYFNVVGIIMLGLIAMAILCASILMWSFTRYRIRAWNNQSNMLIHGEVVAYLTSDNKILNLSAQNFAAQTPVTVRQIEAPKEVEQDTTPDEDTILTMHDMGNSIRHIAKETKTTKYHVEKVINKNRV